MRKSFKSRAGVYRTFPHEITKDELHLGDTLVGYKILVYDLER